MRLNLLGGFELSMPAGPVHVARKKAQALLAYLASPAGQSHPRDKLAALLWPEAGDSLARRSLRQALFALRTSLGPARSGLRIDDDAVSLHSGALDIDVHTFERRLAKGTPEALAEAAALYRGDFLAGLGVAEPAFEEWLLSERERLRELALEGLARLMAHHSRVGDLSTAVQAGIRLLALDPLQEAVHRGLMTLYARQGRRDAALRQYQACVAALQRDLGIEPDMETQRLYKELLAERPVYRSRRAVRHAAPATGWEPGEPEPQLIGRNKESASLERAADAAAGGRGQTIIVVGEAGIGKSRLLHEVGADAVHRGRLVLLGQSSVAQQTLPFGPWIDAFRTARVLDDDEVRQSLDRRWRNELGRLFPELGSDATTSDAEGEVRLFEAISHLLQMLAGAAPLVLLLEDLHWADDTSVRLLGFVARRCRTWPLLIVASTRLEDVAATSVLRDVLRQEPISELALEPLSLAATTALVHALSRKGMDDDAQARLAGQIWKASAGSPFVIVETIRALAQGMEAARPGELPVADRVRALVRSRVERLSDTARTLAAVSAVMRHEFAFELLLAASGLDERAVVEGVEELVRRRLLRVAADRFDFVHDRIREVVYSDLLPPRRRLLHRAVAEALERLHGDEAEEHAAVLGHHYLAAECWREGVTWFERAGVQAMRRSAYRAAGASFTQALDALPRLPSTRESLQLGVDLRLKLMAANVPFRELYASREGLHREAEHLATALGDQRRLTSVLIGRMYDHWLQGDYAGGLEIGRRALTLAQEERDALVARDVRILLTRMLYASGQYRAVVAELSSLVDSVGEQRVPGPTSAMLVSTRIAYYLARSLAELGEFADAIAQAERALRRSHELNHGYSLSFDYRTLGLVHLRQGDVDSVLPLLERAVAMNAEGEYGVVAELDGVAQLARAYLRVGRVADAVALVRPLETAIEPWQSILRLALVETRLEAGDFDEAQRVADQVVAMARELRQRGTLAWALKLVGEIAFRRDPRDLVSAEAHYRAGLDLAVELGMRPLAAHCHLGLAAVAATSRGRASAAEDLDRAIVLYREMDMRYWEHRAASLLAG